MFFHARQELGSSAPSQLRVKDEKLTLFNHTHTHLLTLFPALFLSL